MAKITIRKALGSDEPITLDIRHKAWLKAYNHIFTEEEINNHFKVKIENEEYRKNSVKRIEENDNYFVACIDNKPVAILIMIVDKQELQNNEVVCFYCYPEYQRNGIGKTLFDFAKEIFIKNNIHSFKVEALKDNFVGENFYKKHGGIIVETTKKHLCHKDVDCVIYNFEIKKKK